jgi:putative sugar O-methyltransferase
MGPYRKPWVHNRKSWFRSVARYLALLLPPTARLVAEWDELRQRCAALEKRFRHLEMVKGESDRPLMEQARQHLRLASAALATANLPDPGARWNMYAERTREFVARFTEPLDAIRFAQDATCHGGFETRLEKALVPALAAAEEERLARDFPSFAESLSLWAESIYADPDTTAHYNGRPVSEPIYWIMSYCLFCLDRLPKSPNIVCEVGGGYGGPARLWLTNPIHRPSQYIIVDLPESLFFSELYLAKHFGVDQVFYVGDRSAATATKLAKSPIVLCPNVHIDMLAPVPIDLVINTNSLQEMPEAYVDFFMDWLDRQDSSFFFSINFALQDLRVMRESMNTWSPRMGRIWKTLFLAHTPDARMGRPNQIGLYEKSPHDLVERQACAAKTYTELLSTPLNSYTLATLLDLIRLSMNEIAILSLLRKIRAEYPFTPKEASYLVTWLADHGDCAFLVAHQDEIETVKKRFDGLIKKPMV